MINHSFRAGSNTRRPDRPAQLLLFLVSAILLNSCSTPVGPTASPVPTNTPVSSPTPTPVPAMSMGIAFAPISDASVRAQVLPHLQTLGVTRLRSSEWWKYREPTQGTYTWDSLDARIQWCKDNGIDLLLTFESDGPAWVRVASPATNERSCDFASHNAAFASYVRAVLERYPGFFKRVQFGNEWQSSYWYAGSAEAYTATQNLFYDTVKAVDPSIQVILGGFSTFSLRVLAASKGLITSMYNDQGTLYSGSVLSDLLSGTEGQAYLSRMQSVLQNTRYDLIDLHFYDDVEQWATYHAMIRADWPSKPVIVTEFGGPNAVWEAPYSEAFQATRFVQYVTALKAMNVLDCYWFTMVETADAHHQLSGLISASLVIKPVYWLFQAANTAAP